MVGRLSSIGLQITLAVAAAALLGVVNGQVTATVAPEYYSVIKSREFASVLDRAGLLDAPLRAQAALIGVVGSWWLGLLLGPILSVVAVYGTPSESRHARFGQGLAIVLLCAAAMGAVSGAAAYLTQPVLEPELSRWIGLWGIEDVRSVFAVGWWHRGAYAGALIGVPVAVAATRGRRLSGRQRSGT